MRQMAEDGLHVILHREPFEVAQAFRKAAANASRTFPIA
jgi:hypothetical protein